MARHLVTFIQSFGTGQSHCAARTVEDLSKSALVVPAPFLRGSSASVTSRRSDAEENGEHSDKYQIGAATVKKENGSEAGPWQAL